MERGGFLSLTSLSYLYLAPRQSALSQEGQTPTACPALTGTSPHRLGHPGSCFLRGGYRTDQCVAEETRALETPVGWGGVGSGRGDQGEAWGCSSAQCPEGWLCSGLGLDAWIPLTSTPGAHGNIGGSRRRRGLCRLLFSRSEDFSHQRHL